MTVEKNLWHKFFRAGLCFFSLCVCLLSNSILAQPDNQSSNRCQLTFAWAEWKPVQYADQSGRPVGLQIELVEAIAKKLNCQLSFVFDSWSGVQQRIQNGQADFTANATPTATKGNPCASLSLTDFA